MKKLFLKITLISTLGITLLLGAKSTYAQVVHIITATAYSGGTISPSGSISVDDGTDQTFTITPDAGYGIWRGTIDGMASIYSPAITGSRTYTFTNVVDDHTIVAEFASLLPRMESYSVSCAGGKLAITTLMVNFTYEINSIDPLSNIKIDDTIDPDSITIPGGTKTVPMVLPRLSDGAYTLSIAAGTTINGIVSAEKMTLPFEVKCGVTATYGIEATAGANGKIDPTGAIKVTGGDSQKFDFIPDAGYIVEDVTVDGTSIGVVTSYTFEKIGANHTIHVTFKIEGGGGRMSDSCIAKWPGREDYYKFDNKCESREEIECIKDFSACLGVPQKMKDLESLNALFTSLFGFDITLQNIVKSTAKIVTPEIDFLSFFEGMAKKLQLLNNKIVNGSQAIDTTEADLLMRRPPGREAYPGDVRYTNPKPTKTK